MTQFDFIVIVMGLTIIVVSIYGFAKLGHWGCLFMAGSWILAVVATVANPGQPNPFCS